jgi:hypothetical protein
LTRERWEEDVMGDVQESIEIAASPDAVWAVGGDVGGVAAWIPAITEAHLDGDLRHATLTDGGQVVERIVRRDDAARTYEYEFVEGPFPFRHYRSRFSVTGRDGASTVEWRADLGADDPSVERELVAGIGESYRASLEALRAHIEGRQRP